MKTSLTRTQWVLIAALVFATLPYLTRLGSSSLWDSNEAFYAETPREMIESRDYINPTFNYNARLNKPPLSYWIVIPFYKVIGVSEAAQRLPIALGALAMIATAYGLGRLVFSVDAGLLAAIGLAVAPRFLMFSRRIMIDVYLAMFMSLALLMFVLAERRPHRRRVYLVLMYVSMGLGVITKGPVAVALPSMAFFIYLALHRRLAKLREMMLPAGLGIIAVIVLPWYIAIYLEHGFSNIGTFVLKDNLSRYAQQAWGPSRGLFFYIPVVLGDFFPWSLFLLPVVWLGARSLWLMKRDKSRSASHTNGSAALLATWVAVIVVFFSFSRSKEDLYILPIYPAAAALVGGALAAFIGNGGLQRRGTVRSATFALSMVLVIAGSVVLYLFGQGRPTYELAGAGLIGSVAIVGGLGAAGATVFNRARWAVVATAVTVAACNWVFVLWTLPGFERYKPVRPICEVIASEAGPDALVGYYRAAYPSMVFYLRRPIFEYYELGEIEAALSSDREVFCLMRATEYEAIKTKLPVKTRVLASHPIFQVKLTGILDRSELPQVVLISNEGRTSNAQ